jgi:SPASM domain peptide maturase of grasp-with-spasm system
MTKYLNIYAFCKVITGKENSIICDFQKNVLKYIPDTLVEIITQLQENEFEIVKNQYKSQARIFNSYINFLTHNKFGFFSDYRAEFVAIENHFETPEIINNAVIEYDFKNYDILSLLKALDELFCKYIEIRILSFDFKKIDDLIAVFESSNTSGFRSFKLFIPFNNAKEAKIIYQKLKAYKKIYKIIFYNSNKEQRNFKSQNTQYIKNNMEEIRTRNFHDKNLIIDLHYFFEAQQKNPYYNKKVSIDYQGNIKNCIKNKAVFGNLSTHPLLEVIYNPLFQEFWNVSHNQIIELKDNELRYNRLISNDLNKVSNNLYELIF